METLFTIHSHMRHLIFLMAAISIIAPLIAVIRKQELAGWMKVAIKVYVYTATIQALIGIVQLISRWDQYGDGLRHRLEHAGLMLVVVGILHYGGKFMRMPAPLGPRNTLFVMIASVILVILGISLLPTGPALLGF